jgi:hypothetical protein
LDFVGYPQVCKGIGLVYNKMGDYSKARLFYERATSMRQQSLPPNHPELQRWKNNLERKL